MRMQGLVGVGTVCFYLKVTFSHDVVYITCINQVVDIFLVIKHGITIKQSLLLLR